MNNHSYFGPNFCPNCGCNIRSIAISLAAALPRAPEPEERPMKRIGPAKSNSDLTELYKDIQKGLKEGRRLAAICRELGITPQDVYSYRAKLKRGKELISATEPRTAPAIVRPRAKEVAA
jgi:DNA-binding CsgD family transcriptional regulator